MKGIIYLFDASSLDIESDMKMLQNELKSYNPILLTKPHILVINKIDIWNDPQFTDELIKTISHLGEIIPISAINNIQLDLLLDKIDHLFFDVH